MKKIYSIVLMAVALFMGTNAMAQINEDDEAKIGDKGYATLQEAWAAAKDGETIVLLKNIVDLPSTLALTDGRALYLDLGGKAISFKADVWNYNYEAPITLVHGTLQVFNGTIYHKTSKAKDNIAAIEVFGAGFMNDGQGNYNIKMLGTIGDKNYDNWSTLIVGDGQSETKLIAGYGNLGERAYGAGIAVYGFGNAGIIPSATVAPFLQNLDYKTSSAQAPGGKSQFAAYGVHITVKDNAYVYGDKYGLQIGGNVKQTDDVPTIKVEKGAEVSASKLLEATGIYASGQGVWDIKGEVHGATGVYAKAGTVNINKGAVIYSDCEQYSVPKDKSSGVGASGSAVLFDSQKSHSGQITININDGAKIGVDADGNQKGGGYAIEGNKANDSNNQLIGLNIQGGEITGGGMGTMEPNVLTDAINDGAQFQLDGATVNPKDNADMTGITQLLVVAGMDANHIIVAQTVDEEGNTVYVFEKKEDDTPVTADINVTEGTAYVEWDAAPQDAKITIPEANVKYFSMQSGTLTIPAGKTLKAGSIVLGANAVIDVQAGGKLVITNENGLVANQKSNIKIAYEDGVAGLFYLAPEAKANKNPAATITLKTMSYWNGADYKYERIGVPSVDGMTLNDIKKVAGAGNLYAIYWNAETQKWAQLTNTQKMDPFTGIGLLSQSTTPGSKYDFPCRLLGNTDITMSWTNQWNFYANSYMGNLDLEQFVSEIKNASQGVAAGVYMDFGGKDDENWQPVTYQDFQDPDITPLATKLNPMQGFILNNQSAAAASVEINYQSMIWNPEMVPANSNAPAAAPRMNDELTRIKIMVTNENGRFDAVTLRQSDEFSAEYDNGADFEKLMGFNAIDLFAVTELGNLAQVASNDINGLRLSINAKAAGSYKMTFSNLNGEQMAIRDNLTGATITMVEGAEYFFTATEGDNANRFEIVAVKNAPTDVETVVETTGAKAVYTVLGQYMGTTDNWNTLPNGIYVVDGVKMVK